MRPRSQHEPHPSDTAEDTLARLLRAEERSAARLATARAEADAAIGEARAEAERIAAACAATIETRLAALATEYESRVNSELTAIRRDAEQLVSRFDAVNAERTRHDVAFIMSRLLRAASRPAGASL